MSELSETLGAVRERTRIVIRLDTGVDVESGPTLAELHRRGRASAQLAWIGRKQLAFLVDDGFVERLPLLNIDGRYYFEAEVPDLFHNDLFSEHSSAPQGPAAVPSVNAEPVPARPDSLERAHDLLAESLRMVQDVVDEVGGHLSSPSDARHAIRVIEERRGIKAKPVLVFMFQAVDELRYEVDDEQIFVRKPSTRAAAAYKDAVSLSVKLAPARAASTVMEAEVTHIGDASKWGTSRGKDHLRFVGLDDWKLATLYLCRWAEHELSLWARITTSMRTLKDQPADVVQEPDWLAIGQIALEALGNRLTDLRRAQLETVAANNLSVSDDRSAA